jgi:hypothetical protein
MWRPAPGALLPSVHSRIDARRRRRLRQAAHSVEARSAGDRSDRADHPQRRRSRVNTGGGHLPPEEECCEVVARWCAFLSAGVRQQSHSKPRQPSVAPMGYRHNVPQRRPCIKRVVIPSFVFSIVAEAPARRKSKWRFLSRGDDPSSRPYNQGLGISRGSAFVASWKS